MPNAHIPIVGTRKPDSDVGTPGDPAVAGGGQSPDQAAITRQGPGGRTDAGRNAGWDGAESDGAAKGRNPAPAGGSSDGQSDRPRSPTAGSEE
ncbi:hypothetical protein ASF49_00035 [Methylobacterium sp. Leaf104]|uniref:hypothetical protein n=1 Tax=Methylobacterium TaxID=407 RepID=UPI0006F34CE9|nr:MULTISPECIES: hypothetical protein [Methylobacterium]KQP42291.1 hypothetical protein ASF49_00035 [Methylobacterium sp. Leaf104]MCI9879199.1 hypothetical protein [Methylobacterium goesingense]